MELVLRGGCKSRGQCLAVKTSQMNARCIVSDGEDVVGRFFVGLGLDSCDERMERGLCRYGGLVSNVFVSLSTLGEGTI